MADLLTPSNITKSTALLLATASTFAGIRSFTSPQATASTFGLPQHSSDFNAFIPVYGGHKLASGLALFALAYRGYWKAVGITLCAGVVPAVTDAVVCYRYGRREAMAMHGAGGLLFLGLGTWFFA